jgi:hypothetical protein
MGVSMYPNPTSSLLYITKTQSGMALLELLDLNGKALHQQAMDQPLTLDLSNYPKGLYMVKIQMNGVSVIDRIAVQ